MKKLIICLMAVLGLTTACAQKNYETDEFTTKSGKTVKFHALMHACIRIEARRYRLTLWLSWAIALLIMLLCLRQTISL